MSDEHPGPADPGQSDDRVTCRLDQLSRIQRSMLACGLEQLGLYAGQENALATLWEHGPLTQARLSALVGVDSSTMCRTLQRLERAGYVARTAGETDRRTTVVVATEAAHQLRDRVAGVYDDPEHRLVGGLTADERRQLAGLLQKAIDILEPQCTEELEKRSAVFFPADQLA